MRRANPAGKKMRRGGNRPILEGKRYYGGEDKNDARAVNSMRGAQKRCGGGAAQGRENARPLRPRRK